MCGVGTRIDKAQADHLQAVAAKQVAAPVEITPRRTAHPLPVDGDRVTRPVDSRRRGSRRSGAGGRRIRPAHPRPGWWQASDQRWYPPELHPDAN